MEFKAVILEYAYELATLTLNRPGKRNAISPGMIEELLATLDDLEQSPARVAILTGAGKAFCAGMDLEALQALARRTPEHRVLKGGVLKGGLPRPSDANLADSRRVARLFRRIYDFPKPLIAAVNGAAIAGGCGIATLCDFTLAAPEAKFGYSEVRIGFVPALVSVFLVRQIGEKRARDLLLSGRIIDASEAHRLGLVNEVVPLDKLLERAHALAEELLASSPTSLIYTKRLLRELGEKELDRELELALQENARIRSTADFREGLTAFLEKRKPVWRGE
ncbi:MAG TPA: enoyl-CoA hydratase-related protein [Terriglobia bacterium]|nr:enoyl-CoA hydratase-related protein [Terriglobia bacterium]